MNLKNVLLAIVFGQVSLLCCAQETYVYKFNNGTMAGSIYQLGDDNSLTLITTLGFPEPIYADIAVDPNGDVYGLTQAGVIKRVDMENGTTTEIGAYSDFSAHTAFVSDAASNFYTLDFFNNLFIFNGITLEEELLFNAGELTPGDLGFYNGYLVYPSGDDSSTIKAIDLDTYEIVPIYCLPPEIVSFNSVWGISNIFDSCGNEFLLVSNTENSLFRIDVENDSFEMLDVTYDDDQGGDILGIASHNDIFASECDGMVTAVDCVGGTSVEQLTSKDRGPAYPNPVLDQLNLVDSEHILRVEWHDVNGSLIKSIHQPSSQESLAELPSGIYLMKMYLTNGRVVKQKMIKT